MRIRSRHKIKCDREQVWNKLEDFRYLVRVIPGGRRFSQSESNEYTGDLAGPFNLSLRVALTRERIRMPRSFRLRVYANGNGINIRGKVDFKLKRKGECETEVRYEGNLDIRGLPGFVLGEIHTRLKKALKDLCKKIEKDCKCTEKLPRIEDIAGSERDANVIKSQIEQELAEIISKAQSQFELELAELITKAGSQLKVDLKELINRIENQRQKEDGNAH